MPISLKKIGRRLMMARIEKGLSVQEVATLTGYSAPTLRRYEAMGAKNIITLATLADAYGADLRVILFGQDAAYPKELPETIKKHILALAAAIKEED